VHFTELSIDDFGCFQGARLDGLSDDLVVIGGPQRAGKSTFMQAMRQFRSGIGRGSDLPPATNGYRITGEIIHNGDRCRYVLDGHAEPSVSRIEGGGTISVDDVFGPVSEQQYNQLFTISLDELQRLPPGIDNTDDLAEVLLGAAYGDIAQLPALEDTFDSRADDIGLSQGNPSIKSGEIAPPYKTIQEGMEARSEASRQVDEHDTVTDKLETARSERDAAKDRIDERRDKRSRLGVLAELYDTVSDLDRVEVTLEDADIEAAEAFPTHRVENVKGLQEDFQTAVDDHHERVREFDREATATATLSSEDYRAWLLDTANAIERFSGSRQLWEAQTENLAEDIDDLSTRQGDIETRINELHSEWDGSFEHIEAIETSAISTDRVQSLAAEIKNQRSDLESERADLEHKQARREKLEAERDEMGEADSETHSVTLSKTEPIAVAVAAVLVGTALAFVVTPIIGGLVALVIVAAGMYVIDTTVEVESEVDAEPRREVKGQITTLDAEIDGHESRIEELENSIEANETELAAIAVELGLPQNISPDGVATLHAEVVELDRAIDEYQADRAEWQTAREELADDLSEVKRTFEDALNVEWERTDPFEDVGPLLSTLEAVTADLNRARGVRDARDTRADALTQINDVLEEPDNIDTLPSDANPETVSQRVEEFSERAATATEIREAADEREALITQINSKFDNPSTRTVFEPMREDDESWVSVIRTATAEYADSSEIDGEIDSVENDIENEIETRDDRQAECVELENRRDELASEDDLRAAQETIDNARVEFERAGESYAVNRIAQELIGDVHERFMADVVDSLVDDASEIFSDITGAYDGIELGGGLQDLEFRATRPNSPDHGVSELSRATAEQLFLAVRLARIKQTEVSLPIVIDDAATNFDPGHAARVFEFLDGLAETSQVFFLTCHPGFVHLTSSNGAESQYWGLDGGRFEKLADSEALQRRLGNGVEMGSI
jgi:uncharacterized protein YhaN